MRMLLRLAFDSVDFSVAMLKHSRFFSANNKYYCGLIMFVLALTLIINRKFSLNTMKLSDLLNARRAQLNQTLQQLHDLTGIATSSVSKLLSGKSEAKAGTLEALADALDASWVLVPKHQLPEVQRLLSGKAIGPDEAPSTVDQLFGVGGGAND